MRRARRNNGHPKLTAIIVLNYDKRVTKLSQLKKVSH